MKIIQQNIQCLKRSQFKLNFVKNFQISFSKSVSKGVTYTLPLPPSVTQGSRLIPT